MRINLNLLRTRIFCAVALGIGSFGLAAATEHSAGTAPATTSLAIPWSQLGAKAGAVYQGDALAVIPTAEGARLRCVFQQLEGEATREGLWLTSTAIPPSGTVKDRFRLVAVEVGRGATAQSANIQPSTSGIQLSATGTVSIDGQTARFTRPALVEEYTVSIDGVRQDFVVLERPSGLGELVLRLAVSGARVESAAFGAQMVLANSGRKIAYGRLRVTDTTGKELTARVQVASDLPAPASLAVVVDDAAAVYPVRIDPTFSDANWSSMNPRIPGADGTVAAAVMDASGNLYIGGWFTVAGEVVANRVAKWDGSSWTALGSGLDGLVSALAVSGSNLYAGGSFTTAGGSSATYVAKWNGSSWTALDSGLDGAVSALVVSGNDLYAGGTFTTAGGLAATNVAKWDGSSWSALGSGLRGGDFDSVYALAVSGSNVYVGGSFTTAGGIAATNIAKWDGSSWSALGSGVDSWVRALAVSGSDLYVGGHFNTAGGLVAANIAKWDGSSWTALGSGLEGGYPYVYALAVSGNDVYAGGSFATAGGSTANSIAKWDGSSWSALGSGTSGGYYADVYALAVSGSDLYAGGELTMAGGNTANSIANWNGSTWSALGSGIGGDYPTFIVSALAVSGSDLYAGGTFTTADGSAATTVAKWDGNSWTTLGSGMNGGVVALAVSGSDLYAAGAFTTAGGIVANSIAKWNGSNWSALGSGLNDVVSALAVSGSDLYVGGQFTTAGGIAANSIAKWNGSNWSALGSGMDGEYPPVFALAVSGSDVYAGGGFTKAGGSTANRIAKWNGSNWSALGSGLNDYPTALAVSGNDLYVGGQFTTAGGVAANFIAKWNGANWSALGSGMNGGVAALAVSGSDLYVGGQFTTAGGVAANSIAKWTGSSWTALGSGIHRAGIYGAVYALTVLGNDLYVGGQFSTAGGKVSAYIARAYLPALPTLSVLRSSENVTVSWPAVDTAGFVLEQAGPLAAPVGWATNSATVIDDGTNKSVTLPATNSSQYFRLRRP